MVSIILPTHNRADVLPFAVKSALYQTFQDFELLIAGDGCTDNTEEVVKSFNDSRIKWYDLPKSPGIGYSCRNVAARDAKGKYIAYLAHDDIWLPDHLELLLSQMENDGKEFIYSRGLNVTPDGIIWPYYNDLNNPRCLNGFIAGTRITMPLSAIIHTKDCFEKYGYWDENILSRGDIELYLRIFRGGEFRNFSYYYLPTVLKFRALWHGRDRRWWKRPPIDIMNKFRMMDAVFPKELMFDVEPGHTEQETLWDIINKNPQAWTEQIRKSVFLWMDSRLYEINFFFPLLMIKLGNWVKSPIRIFRNKIDKEEFKSVETKK